MGKTLQEPQGVVLKEFWGVDVWLQPQNPQPVPDLAQLNFAIYPILDQTSELPSTYPGATIL